jgi:hypothetical protein
MRQPLVLHQVTNRELRPVPPADGLLTSAVSEVWIARRPNE